LALSCTDRRTTGYRLRLYGKRWGIEVFFKTVKHLLNLEREMRVRDYGAIIGHTTLVSCRFLSMSLKQRLTTDQRTAGDLFFACCDEIRDLTELEALQLAFSLLRDKIHNLGVAIEDPISSLIDKTLGTVIEMMRMILAKHHKNNGLSSC
jgi:hypothetical protein